MMNAKLPHGRRTTTDIIRENIALLRAVDTSGNLDCGCSTCDAEGHGMDAHECMPFCRVCRTEVRDAVVRHSGTPTPTSSELLADLALTFGLPPDDMDDLSEAVRWELRLLGAF